MKKVFFLFLSVLILSVSAQAGSLSVHLLGERLHYWELGNRKRTLDQDTVFLKGVGFSYLTQEHSIFGIVPYQNVSFSYLQGYGHYDGSTWGGVRYETKTQEKIWNVELQNGVVVPFRTAGVYSAVLLGYKYWHRKIYGGLDAKKEYVLSVRNHKRIYYTGITAGAYVPLVPGITTGVNASWLWSPKYKSIVQDEDGKRHIGTITGYRIRIPIRVQIQSITLQATGFYTYWRYRKSTVTNNTIEPGGKERDVGFSILLDYVF